MEKQRDFKIIDGFLLKLMAIIFMTFDHVGLYLSKFKNLREISDIFRILGRFALPIFIFLLVEGVIHTKNIRKYFLRLGLLASAFLIGQLFYIIVIDKNSHDMYSPAVDLLLTATIVYLLKRKDKFSLFAIIPIAWSIVALIVKNNEIVSGSYSKWFPFYLRPDYGIYAPLLGIAFFYAHDLTKLFLSSSEGTKSFLGTTYEQTTCNVVSAVLLVIITVSICFIDRNAMALIYAMPWQIYALFAFIPILFYSGKRGYNAKWFQYGCYIYFPMHLIIIFTIFELLL